MSHKRIAGETKQASGRIASAPVLCTMPDMEDFDSLTCDAVHDNVRRGDEFAGSF